MDREERSEIVLHKRGRCVGVRVGNRVYTHNMTLRNSQDWLLVDPEDVPERLHGYFVAAIRRAQGEP